VRFPAWRIWVDSRVRLDDAVLDMLAAMDLAMVAINDRATDDDQQISSPATSFRMATGSPFPFP
jgi:hypothetical protein